MRKLIQFLLPPFLFNFLKKKKRKLYWLNLNKQKNTGSIITQNMLLEFYKSVGIKETDHVMVHSSMRKIGFLQDGAHTVIQSLISYLSKGTLLMPAFPANQSYKSYLQKNKVFNVNTTPSLMGVITEVFRTKYATHRSLHPTDSICAKGLLADYFTNSHLNQLTPYNEHSPYYKLFLQKGKVMMLGVNISYLSIIHTVEDMLGNKFYPPVFDSEIMEIDIIDKNNIIHKTRTKVHNPDLHKYRNPMFLEEELLKSKAIVKVNFNNAIVYIADAYLLYNTMVMLHNEKKMTMYKMPTL